jgi:hypothetical protein
MKCVGAEDGNQPCQRCRRTGVEYVPIQYPRYLSLLSLTRSGVCSRDTDAAESQAQSLFDFVPHVRVFSIGYTGYPKLPKC